MSKQVYSKHWGVFRNSGVKKELDQLNPEIDYQRMVQLLVGYEFPFDVNRALELALFHTFASPKISELLNKTGQFKHHGQKRYDDTSLLIARFMQDGLESESGLKAIEQINHIHGHFKIENPEFLIVLSTFITYPINWVNRFGWRKLSKNEELAFFKFFIEVGKRMHIQNLPNTLEELKQFANLYENEHFKFAESNKNLADSTVKIVENWFPFILRPIIKPSFSCLIDQKLRTAFGYKKPGRLFSSVLLGALWLRRIPLRWITFKPYPTLISNSKYRAYPNGIPDIEETGPNNILKAKN